MECKCTTTQTHKIYLGISLQQHGISGNRHKIRMQLGEITIMNAQILDGYRPTATNTEFAWALHPLEEVWYLDRYYPVSIHLEIWTGRPISTEMVIGCVLANSNKNGTSMGIISPERNSMEFHRHRIRIQWG